MSKLMLSLFAAIVAMGLSAAPSSTYAETDDAATEEAADESEDSGADEGE
jgi:hypothetical protein